MKKRLIVLAVIAVVGMLFIGQSMAGWKIYSYTPFCDSVVLTGATDSNTTVSGQIPLFNNTSGGNIIMYDRFSVCYYFAAVSEGLDVSGVSGEGNTDSVIVKTIFGSPYFSYTMYDTCGTLPCSVLHTIDESGFVFSGTTVRDTTDIPLTFDYWYYDVYATDSAAHGEGDTLEFIFNGWYKFWQEQ